jgi:hypothetical protein
MDVVTADGQFRTVNAAQHQDLFWAMRGGGGNFGTVVSFTYRLHPVNMVLAGPISYPPQRAPDALRLYHQVASTAPDPLATAASVVRGADGEPCVSVVACWSGPADEGERVLRPLREFGPPIADAVGLIPYRELQSMPDPGFPPGRPTSRAPTIRTTSSGSTRTLSPRAERERDSPHTSVTARRLTQYAPVSRSTAKFGSPRRTAVPGRESSTSADHGTWPAPSGFGDGPCRIRVVRRW